MSNQTQAQFSRAAKKIEKLAKALGTKLPSGLRLIGEEIMLDVKASRPGAGVPVDRGNLRSTGRVDGPKDNRVELSFGGAAAPYALVQHEDTSLHHTVGEARYLVRGVDRWSPHGASAKAAMAQLQQAVDNVARGS